MNFRTYTLLVVAAGLGAIMVAWIFTAKPDYTATQIGYRGIGMEVGRFVPEAEAIAAANIAPAPVYDREDDDGTAERASAIYENVQVLGHLSDANFTRLMAQITEWVAPEQGCAYCHAKADDGEFADDDLYTKVVSRRMMQMTQAINADWGDHVAPAGVNCYTCHRGQNVPANLYFAEDGGPAGSAIGLGWRRGQNVVSPTAGYTSMETDPIAPYLLGDTGAQRVQTKNALPLSGEAANPATLQDTETVYAMMIHMSTGLGVNCTFCHNTRNFGGWETSPPQRQTAWYGIRMARNLNVEYLEPLKPVYPEHRLGPLGDAPKANCSTCHQGVNKPLAGADMISAFPGLAAPGPAELQDPAPAAGATN